MFCGTPLTFFNTCGTIINKFPTPILNKGAILGGWLTRSLLAVAHRGTPYYFRCSLSNTSVRLPRVSQTSGNPSDGMPSSCSLLEFRMLAATAIGTTDHTIKLFYRLLSTGPVLPIVVFDIFRLWEVYYHLWDACLQCTKFDFLIRCLRHLTRLRGSVLCGISPVPIR